MIDLDNAHIQDEDLPADTAAKTIATVGKPQVPALDGQETARDRHTKKIFVIDRSASMRSDIAAVSRMGLLLWPDEVYEWAEKRVINALVRIGKEEDDYLSDIGEEPEAAGEAQELCKIDHDEPGEDEYWAELAGVDRDTIRTAVLRHNLTIPFEKDKSFRVGKYELVRAVLARIIRERVHKFPDAKFHGIFFDNTPHHILTSVMDPERGMITRPATAEEIITAVNEDGFHGGGTNIHKGLASAVALCRRSPSAVKLHHVILITDGLDYGALECINFVEPMKKLGICLDVIHISDEPSTEVGELLQRVCNATGGEYQVADDVEAFQTKLLNAAGRLLLTAGGAQ